MRSFITSEIVIGIELRRVLRYVEYLYLVAVPGFPRAYLADVVHPQIVEDQIDFAIDVLNQALYEADQPLGFHAPS